MACRPTGSASPPNASATKLAAILDEIDPERTRTGEQLCFGTVDSWVAWTLSGGAQGGVHVTDATNAAVTWLLRARHPGLGRAVT